MKALGRHFILECYDCDAEILNDIDKIEYSIKEAARAAKTTIIKSLFHHFAPQGVSGVLVIAESHITVHTWPEHHYAAVDVFTCGDDADPEAACSFLIDAFAAQRTTMFEIKRGQDVLEKKVGGRCKIIPLPLLNEKS